MKEIRPSVLILPPESSVYTAPKDSDTCEELVTHEAVGLGIFVLLPPIRTKRGEIEYRGRIIATEDADKSLQNMPVYYYKR